MASINRRTSTRITSSLRNITISSENAVSGKSFSYTKRKAENSPPKNGPLKRAAFCDLTNDGKTAKVKSIVKNDKKLTVLTEKSNVKNCTTDKVNAVVKAGKKPIEAEKSKENQVSKLTTRAQCTTDKVNAVVKTGKKPIETEKSKENQVSKLTTRAQVNRLKGSTVVRTENKSQPVAVRNVESQAKNEISKPVTRTTLSRIVTGVRIPRPSTKNLPCPVKDVPCPVKDIPKDEPAVVLPCPVEVVKAAPRRSARLSASRQSLSADKSSDCNSLYVSALEDVSNISVKEPEKVTKIEKISLNELSEFDKELLHDPQQVSLYAMEIFHYLRSRESHFPISDYMPRQTLITKRMRAMLVDWMVEVQENFELNHETLYLSVKIVDMYLDKEKISRENLQLVGATSLFLACKYDERLSPLLEDFVYVCDGAYSQDDLLVMEQKLLKTINFELSMPISYSFLRRYARCARIQMPLLTLARFILELSLLDYSTVTLSDSKQAAAALYLAFRMVKHGDWTDSLVYYTGYKLEDFKDIVFLFNGILHKPLAENLMTVRKKYSHELFFKVAKTPLISDEELRGSMVLHTPIC